MNLPNGLMAQLCHHFGLTEPAGHSNFTYFKIDGIAINLKITGCNGQQQLTLYSPLGTVSIEHESLLYRMFLEANLFWSGTGGGTIGVNTETNEAFLAYAIAPDTLENLNSDSFIFIVKRFVAFVIDWRQYIKKPLNSDLDNHPLLEPFNSSMIKA